MTLGISTTGPAGAVGAASSDPRPLRRGFRRRHAEAVVEDESPVEVRAMALWKSTLVAVASLAMALGVAVALMSGVGAILHAVNPAKQFDIFYALHNEVVVGCLIGVSLLWLLPPHPWAKRLAEATAGDRPAQDAGEAGVGEPGTAAALSMYQGSGPASPADESQEVADEMTTS